MGGTYSMSYTPITGDTITAARWITAHSEHIAGNDFVGLGDYSASTAEMRTTTDPYPAAVESLATAGTGELERLRYLIGQVGGKVNQAGYWYQDPLIAQTCFGRLTLTSGTAVTTSDVTAAGTIYFTPYKGSTIALYDGTSWNLYTLSEISLALTATSGKPYDVWVYDNSGTLTLETTVWTNDTTRATALALQNGVYCKTGALTRRYVGTFYASASNQTEDSVAKRYVWNYYNRVVRPMRVLEATDSWVYTTATIRQANGATANQLDCVIGVSEDRVCADVIVSVANNNAVASLFYALIGLDSTTAMATGCIAIPATDAVNNVNSIARASWKGYPGAGRHTLTWLEYSDAVGATTWYGDNGIPTRFQSGIHGEVPG